MDYKALAQQTAQEILGYYQDTSGWKVVKTSKKITVSSKASKKFHGNLFWCLRDQTSVDSNLCIKETLEAWFPIGHPWVNISHYWSQVVLGPQSQYRVEGIIPESTSKLSDFLYKPENRVTWDKSLKVYNMVQKIDSDTCICHTITQSFAMGSISPRDFIDLVYLKHYEGNMDIISSTSVDFPAYPQSSNYIRGYNHACGYICSPLQENPAYSKLVMFVQTEMRGKLAPSIIEATMPSNLVSFILNVQDGIKTHKIPSGRGYHHNGHSSLLKKK
ncbi:stAR-related lipid transfer protein 6 isoform X1 [Hippopotamus amphibius kiboko]|uniref:stAR-related lipid transfer protein 6 isoform X1 n=1 Tax=Hippopotamus amphibius kiboko TaxID=575201 RepID=UPI002592C78D|nr:stAR-related lipid transfer protein 6 isoform X1 [Hippopotamus amphibius kiboko]XP_057554217.1 stAR-related lipid transfer protein 6 isoform X1 [Hippopotamus amphibius kiboko]